MTTPPSNPPDAPVAAEALGFSVWRRHAWADALGHRPFGGERGTTTGMADIQRRHLAFVRPMRVAGGQDAEEDEAPLPIVAGRPIAPGGVARQAWADAESGDEATTARGGGVDAGIRAGSDTAPGPGLDTGTALSEDVRSNTQGGLTIARRVGARPGAPSPSPSDGASAATSDTAPTVSTAVTAPTATFFSASRDTRPAPSIDLRPVAADAVGTGAGPGRVTASAPTTQAAVDRPIARAARNGRSLADSASTGVGSGPDVASRREAGMPVSMWPADPARPAGGGDAGTVAGVMKRASTTAAPASVAVDRVPAASTGIPSAHGRPSPPPGPTSDRSVPPSSPMTAPAPDLPIARAAASAHLAARSGTPPIPPTLPTPFAPLTPRLPIASLRADTPEALPRRRDDGVSTPPGRDLDRNAPTGPAAHRAQDGGAASDAHANAQNRVAVAFPIASGTTVAASPAVLARPAVSRSDPAAAGRAVMARRDAPDHPARGGGSPATGHDPGQDNGNGVAAAGILARRREDESPALAISAPRPASPPTQSPGAGAASMPLRDSGARSTPPPPAALALPSMTTTATRHVLLSRAREPSLPDFADAPWPGSTGDSAPVSASAVRHAPDMAPLTLLAAPSVGGAAASAVRGGTLARSPDAASPRWPVASPDDPDALLRSTAEQGFGVVPVAAEAPASAPSPPLATAAPGAAAAGGIDLEDLVDRAVQALLHKLDIERERRGFATWP